MKSRPVASIGATTLSLLLSMYLLSGCGGGKKNLAPPAAVSHLLEISSDALPSGTTGATYAGATGFPLKASGGIAPYKWSWIATTNSSLPLGIALTDTTISGSPTAGDSYSVIVTVADSESPSAQTSVSHAIGIDMPLEITSDAPPNGTVGVGYGPVSTEDLKCSWSPVLGWHWASVPCAHGSCPTLHCFRYPACLLIERSFPGFPLTAAGGLSPYVWEASGLPPGLTVGANSGKITGTPTTSGNYSASFTVRDSESPLVQTIMNYTVIIEDSSAPE
jgi:hypothetical protein